MSAKFTTASNTTVADRLDNISGSPLQLSDGYFVFVRYDPSQAGGSQLDLCITPPDMSSITVILSGVDGGFSGMSLNSASAGGASVEANPVVGICRDSSDNLFLIVSTASASQAFKCRGLTKGSGHSWTAQTVLSGNMSLSGGFLYNPNAFKMAWCNTGTGTNNAGYLFVQYQCSDAGSGNPTVGYATLDAGVLLAGSGSVPTASGPNVSYLAAGSTPPAAGLSADGHDIDPDGFGATSGIAAGQDVWSQNTVSVGRWGVSTTGTLTTNTNITPSIATVNSTWKRVRVIRYASNSWLAVMASDSTSNLKLQRFSSTALVGSAVDLGAPTGWPSLGGNGKNWDVFLDPVTANKVWFVAVSGTTATTILMLGVDLTSGITVDAAVTTIDTSVGSGTDSSLACVRHPVNSTVQILIQNLNSTTYSLLGDYASFSFVATKTQTATARVSITPTKTQTAISRVRVIDTLTQTATSRIQKSVTKTQTATAKIVLLRTKTQTATARIKVVGRTKTQTATARVRRTGLTKTQTATARIAITPTKTQSATARLRVVDTLTQTASSRIQVVDTLTQTATSRVQKSVTKTQTATAHIALLGSKTQTATARIRAVDTLTQTAVSRIRVVDTLTQPATGRLSVIDTLTQPASARIRSAITKTQTAQGRIQKQVTATQTATARLVFDGWSSDNLLNPWQDVTIAGAWQDQSGGTSNLYAAIDENTPVDTDYIISPASGSSVYECRIEKIADPHISTGHTIHVRYEKDSAANTVNLKVELVQGTTIIATRTYTNITTAFVQADETLTPTETDAITDYTDLRLRFTVTETP